MDEAVLKKAKETKRKVVYETAGDSQFPIESVYVRKGEFTSQELLTIALKSGGGTIIGKIQE